MIHNRIPSEHRAVRQMQRAWDTPKIAVCPDSGCACCSLKSQYPQIVMSPLFRKRGHFFFSDTEKTAEKCPLYSRGLFENIAHLFPDKRQKHVRVLFGDFNIHHKIPLDFFRELHILTVRKLMFPFYRGNPPPVLVGGCLIFYTFVRIGENRFLPMQSHQNRTQC